LIAKRRFIKDFLLACNGFNLRECAIMNANTSPLTGEYISAKARNHIAASNAVQPKHQNEMKPEVKFVVHLVDWF
jgi:hypothetical protein